MVQLVIQEGCMLFVYLPATFPTKNARPGTSRYTCSQKTYNLPKLHDIFLKNAPHFKSCTGSSTSYNCVVTTTKSDEKNEIRNSALCVVIETDLDRLVDRL